MCDLECERAFDLFVKVILRKCFAFCINVHVQTYKYVCTHRDCLGVLLGVRNQRPVATM